MHDSAGVIQLPPVQKRGGNKSRRENRSAESSLIPTGKQFNTKLPNEAMKMKCSFISTRIKIR